MNPVKRVGVVGAGVISHAYLSSIDRCADLELRSICSRSHTTAERQAARYGGTAVSLDDLLRDPEVDIVVNLAPPDLHFEIGRKILSAGKHLYSEKPFATSMADAETLLRLAEDRGLRVACAPDTFLGAAHQATRRALDSGVIGAVTSGAVAMQSFGMEHWHPNPAFFYQPGGGPHLDLGPYYLTLLVFLLGPVAEVSALASQPRRHRSFVATGGEPQSFEVNVPTTFNGSLLFASGANVALSLSWDVKQHRRSQIELYGESGSLIGADPNDFVGGVETSTQAGVWTVYEGHARAHKAPVAPELVGKGMALLNAGVDPLSGKALGKGGPAPLGDLRGLGLIDLASAIDERRSPRASGRLACHVLEVLLGLETASQQRRCVSIRSSIERPSPLPYKGSAQ